MKTYDFTRQQQIDFGRKLRDEGIQKAVDNAESKEEGWSDTAYQYFKIYINNKPRGFKFMIEDFREYIRGTLPLPPSKRAFGVLAIRGKRDRLIAKAGHGQVVNPTAHRCFASVWIKL